MAILKSPILVQQRMTLDGAMPRAATSNAIQGAAPTQSAPDPRLVIEAELKARFEAEFAAKLDAVREEAKAEGYKAGLDEGHKDGMASAVASFKKKQALLDAVLEKSEAALEDWLLSVGAQAQEIAADALVQLIGEQATDPAALQAVIRRVTAGLRDGDVLSIRLFPIECQALRAALKQASTTGTAGLSRIADRLVEDDSLTAGGVVVDTPRGEYRATLDVQLRKLMNLLATRRAQPVGLSDHVVHAIRA